MKRIYKTITVFLFLSLGTVFSLPVLADGIENTKTKAAEEAGHEHEVEFYDYHSGVTYSYSLFNFIHPRADKKLTEQEQVQPGVAGY